MPRLHRLFIALLVVCMSVPVWAAEPGQVGDKPSLAMRTIDNIAFTSKDLRGKLVVMEFWATWCGPCVKIAPHMVELHKKYAPQGVAFVGISRDHSSREVKKFQEKVGMTWPQVLDSSQTARGFEGWSVNGIPTAFIISPEGEILWRGHPGGIDQPLEEFANKYLSEKSDSGKEESSEDDPQAALDQIKIALVAVDKQDYDAAMAAVDAIAQDALHDKTVRLRIKALVFRLRPNPSNIDQIKAALAAHPGAVVKLQEVAKLTGDAAIAKYLEKLLPQEGETAQEVSTVPADAADANDAEAKDTAPTSRAEQLAQRKLDIADKARERGDDVAAYELYVSAARATDTQAGQKAAEQVAAYDADPEFVARLEAARRDRDADAILSMGVSYMKGDNKAMAIEKFQELMKKYPDSKQADQARRHLQEIES